MALDRERIEKSVRKLRKILKKQPRRPTPAQIHDLRTHSRRFEAALGALKLDCKKNERKLLQDLKTVRRRAGKVRDMDVLTGHGSGLQVEQDRDCKVQLLEHLGSERYRFADRLHMQMRKTAGPLQRRLKRSARRFEKLIPDAHGQSSAADRASSEAAGTALGLTADLHKPATLNKGNLHPYRLKVKELRNVLQMANNGKQDFVKILGQVKDAIGEWHDWEELIGIADDLLDDGANCALMRTLKTMSDKKFQQALSLANKMRREYLRVSAGRKKGASGNKPRLIRPVMEAAEAIAS